MRQKQSSQRPANLYRQAGIDNKKTLSTLRPDKRTAHNIFEKLNIETAVLLSGIVLIPSGFAGRPESKKKVKKVMYNKQISSSYIYKIYILFLLFSFKIQKN